MEVCFFWLSIFRHPRPPTLALPAFSKEIECLVIPDLRAFVTDAGLIHHCQLRQIALPLSSENRGCCYSIMRFEVMIASATVSLTARAGIPSLPVTALTA